MVHPVHGTDPDKEEHRTYKTLEPEGEMAVVQRPEGVIKIGLLYLQRRDKKTAIPRSSWTTATPSIWPWKSCNTPTVWARESIEDSSQ